MPSLMHFKWLECKKHPLVLTFVGVSFRVPAVRALVNVTMQAFLAPTLV